MKEWLLSPFVAIINAVTKGSAARPYTSSTQERAYAENQVDCEKQRCYHQSTQ